jgi:hypothetical protein
MKILLLGLLLLAGCGETVLKVPVDEYGHISNMKKECSTHKDAIFEVYGNLIEYYNSERPKGYSYEFQLVVECKYRDITKVVKQTIEYGNNPKYKTRWW